VEDHIARQTAENLHAGLLPVEARREALLKFGALEGVKESYRDQQGLPFLETLVRDTRHALCRLDKARLSPSPGDSGRRPDTRMPALVASLIPALRASSISPVFEVISPIQTLIQAVEHVATMAASVPRRLQGRSLPQPA
jgi:hypothetical protein